MHVRERGELEHQRLGRAGKTGDRARQDIGGELVAIGVVPQRERAWLVLADRLEHLPERRVHDAPDQQHTEHEDAQHEDVHRRRVRQVDHSEQVPAGHCLDAVLAAGEWRLQIEEVHHLRQRERDHREVDALAPDGQHAGDDREHGRAAGREQHGQLRGEPPDLGRVRSCVAGGAEEHRVPEGQQPSEPDQQIERTREQGKAHHLHQEHRIDDHRCDDEDSEQDAERYAHVTRVVVDLLAGGRLDHGCHGELDSYFWVPNRPAGLTRRTSAITTKITVLDASG